MPPMPEGTTRTLIRGLRLLDALSQSSHPLRLVDLARRTDLNLNTASRLLATLEAEGFALRLPDNTWTLGGRFVTAAARAMNVLSMASLARPWLQEVRDQVRETSMLVTRAGDDLVVVAAVEGPQELRVVLSAGLVAPLLPAATGWALLADEPLELVLGVQERLGPARSNDTPEEVAQVLEQLRRERQVVRHSLPDHGGTCTFGTPIRVHGTIAAALGVAGPSRRWNEETIAPALPQLLEVADGIAASLSGAMPVPARLVGPGPS